MGTRTHTCTHTHKGQPVSECAPVLKKPHNIIQNKIRNMKLPQQLLAFNFCRFGGFCGSVIPAFYSRPYPLVFLFVFASSQSAQSLSIDTCGLCCAVQVHAGMVGLISRHVIFLCFLTPASIRAGFLDMFKACKGRAKTIRTDRAVTWKKTRRLRASKHWICMLAGWSKKDQAAKCLMCWHVEKSVKVSWHSNSHIPSCWRHHLQFWLPRSQTLFTDSSTGSWKS